MDVPALPWLVPPCRGNLSIGRPSAPPPAPKRVSCIACARQPPSAQDLPTTSETVRRSSSSGGFGSGTDLASVGRMTISRAIFVSCVSILVAAPRASAKPPGVPVELGPITGSAGDRRTVVADSAALRQTTWYDVQDGHEHHVRGLPLEEFLARVKAPKAADAVVFEYADGMQIPVRLRDKDEVKAIFIAFEHGDAMERFDTSYPLLNKAVLPCPKVVYGRHVTTYDIWI